MTSSTKPGQPFILVTSDSVGPLTLRASRSDLERLTKFVRDTTEGGGEGTTARMLIVLLDGDTVHALVDDSSRVLAYYLYSARFRTRDSLGVSSSLSQLLRVPGVYATTGESRVTVHFPKHCGLYFLLSESEVGGEGGDSVGPSELSQLPKETSVIELGVAGCHPKEVAAPPT